MIWIRDEATRQWHLVSLESKTGGGESDETPDGVEEVACVAIPVVDGNGTDAIYHRVLPTDTLQGLCLKYKVTPTKLRQWNKFSGSDLRFAPQTLVIHPTKQYIRTDPEISPEERKIQLFLAAFQGRANSHGGVSRKEAIAYLSMHGGNIADAIEDAKTDLHWEDEEAAAGSTND